MLSQASIVNQTHAPNTVAELWKNIQKHSVTMRWCLNMLFATNAAKATIYGKRDGVLTGLAVVSGADKHNLMKQSRGWKQGTVHGVSMLPRNQMWKPDSVSWPRGHQPPLVDI